MTFVIGINKPIRPIKLDLRNAPQVAKNDLITPVINLSCAMCGASRTKLRTCDIKTCDIETCDRGTCNIACSCAITPCVVFLSPPAKGYRLPFLKGRIYG
jgi:hypothetical protein